MCTHSWQKCYNAVVIFQDFLFLAELLIISVDYYSLPDLDRIGGGEDLHSFAFETICSHMGCGKCANFFTHIHTYYINFIFLRWSEVIFVNNWKNILQILIPFKMAIHSNLKGS